MKKIKGSNPQTVSPMNTLMGLCVAQDINPVKPNLIDHINAKYSYCQKSGTFSHRSKTRRYHLDGKLGTPTPSGRLSFKMKKHQWFVDELVWIMENKRFPINKIIPIDCDRNNTHISNLTEGENPLSTIQRNKYYHYSLPNPSLPPVKKKPIDLTRFPEPIELFIKNCLTFGDHSKVIHTVKLSEAFYASEYGDTSITKQMLIMVFKTAMVQRGAVHHKSLYYNRKRRGGFVGVQVN